MNRLKVAEAYFKSHYAISEKKHCFTCGAEMVFDKMVRMYYIDGKRIQCHLSYRCPNKKISLNPFDFEHMSQPSNVSFELPDEAFETYKYKTLDLIPRLKRRLTGYGKKS